MWNTTSFRSYWNNLLFVLMGIIVFSNLSSVITMTYMGFPFSFNELLMLPFIVLLKKKFKSFKMLGSIPAICFMTILLIGIALVYGRFSAYAILSNARAWFYLFLGYCVFKKDNAVTTGDLLCLSFGMIIGWALMSVYNIFFVYTALTTTEYYERAVEASGVMIGIPMFFALAFSHKNKLLLLSGIALFIFICMFSGLRRIIIVGLVSIFATITVTALNNKKKIFSYVLGGFVVVMILMAILPLAENYIKELSPMLHHRIFYRTQNFFAGTGGDEGDMTRVNNMIKFADEFIDYTIPRGFLSMQTTTDKGTGLFNDFPITMVCWIFSWPLALFFLIKYCRTMLRNYSRFRLSGNSENLLSTICVLIMLLLLFLEGSYLSYAESALITGCMLGRAVRNSHLQAY